MSKTLFRENGVKMSKKWYVIFLCLGLIGFTALTVKYWEITRWQPLVVLVSLFMLEWNGYLIREFIDFDIECDGLILLFILSKLCFYGFCFKTISGLAAFLRPPFWPSFVFWGIYLGIVGSAYAVAVSGIRILSDE